MYRVLKRGIDLAAAVAGLIILFPVFVVITVAVKLDSKGPVFYLAERVGYHGRRFRMYKFRTMCVNAEALGTTTAHNDARITRVGKFLRKYKLDELPQLIHVAKGEMSLVGPRPEVEEHTRLYDNEEKLILSVPPGITDYSSIRFVNLGEVLGSENAHDVFVSTVRREKNRLRLAYVKNRSFLEDMRILFLTLWTLLRVASGRFEGGQDCSTRGLV